MPPDPPARTLWIKHVGVGQQPVEVLPALGRA